MARQRESCGSSDGAADGEAGEGGCAERRIVCGIGSSGRAERLVRISLSERELRAERGNGNGECVCDGNGEICKTYP